MKELEKCKKDIIYFVEHYLTINKKHIKLNNAQKNFIQFLNNVNYLNLQHNLIYIHSRNTYNKTANAYIRAYQEFTRDRE